MGLSKKISEVHMPDWQSSYFDYYLVCGTFQEIRKNIQKFFLLGEGLGSLPALLGAYSPNSSLWSDICQTYMAVSVSTYTS